MYLNDFIKEDGSFYNEHEFTEIYNIQTNFIQYNGIINAIKTFLKKNNINNSL